MTGENIILRWYDNLSYWSDKIPKTIIINLIHRVLVLIKLDLNDIKSIFNLYYLFSNKNK